MKTISIKQPWAYLICSGIKDIENRTWNTKFRGRVLVHASAKPDYDIINTNNPEIYNVLEKEEFTFKDDIDAYCAVSAIIGSVEIVDCYINHPSIWAEKTELPEKLSNECIWNWVLTNPILFDKPILNVKGKLSFWEYDLTEQILRNIEEIRKHLEL